MPQAWIAALTYPHHMYLGLLTDRTSFFRVLVELVLDLLHIDPVSPQKLIVRAVLIPYAVSLARVDVRVDDRTQKPYYSLLAEAELSVQDVCDRGVITPRLIVYLVDDCLVGDLPRFFLHDSAADAVGVKLYVHFLPQPFAHILS